VFLFEQCVEITPLEFKRMNLITSIILIVEDETLIRDYLGEILENAGYRVISAANADEAIEILESRTDIRVLLTDINMPGSMDGLRLAAAVKDRWPPIKIIIATGKEAPRREEMPMDSQFLPKPYAPDRVVAAVARVY
jgi:two-component system, response regulator PdtaR